MRSSWAPLLFLAAAFAVYFPALFNEYTYDSPQTVGDYYERQIPLSSIWDLDNYGSLTGVQSWRPLGVANMIIFDALLFRGTPALSHALNILIHALNGFLVFRMARIFSGPVIDSKNEVLALIAALFFLLHPLVSEAVYCAGFRFDLLAMTFILLAITAADWRMELPQTELDKEVDRVHPVPPYLFVALPFVMGLLVKEITAAALLIAPAATLLIEGNRRRTVGLLILLGALFAAFFYFWRMFQYENYNQEFLGGGGRALGIANFLVISVEVYLRKLLLPWPLLVDYNFQPVSDFADGRLLFAGVVLAVAAFTCGVFAWRNRCCALGLFWVMTAFGPVSQITPIPDPVAERFAYVPMGGAALFLFGLLQEVCWRWGVSLRAIAIAACVLLIPCAGLTFVRGLQWRDDVTLNIANWEASPPSQKADLSLGALYLTRAFEIAAEEPDRAESLLLQSEERLLRALERDSEEPETHRLLALNYFRRGQDEGARQHIRDALRLAPDNQQIQRAATLMGVE